jgi:hypothetical protein
MIEEILGPGHGRADRLSGSGKARTPESERAPGRPGSARLPDVIVSSELRELIERVKSAETFRKERVHQVLEKLQRGELVTSETVIEAAERILGGGP